MQIANDGAGNHHGRAGPDALQESKDNQRFHIGREAAADACQNEKAQPEIERRLAAEPIREWPIGDLADRNRQKEAHQAHLHGADIDLKLAGNGREGRQIHVDGERPDSGEHAEDQRVTQKDGLHGERLS